MQIKYNLENISNKGTSGFWSLHVDHVIHTHLDTYTINKQINVYMLKIKNLNFLKVENPEGLNTFLSHMYALSKWNGEDVNNPNRFITSNKIKAVTKSFLS